MSSIYANVLSEEDIQYLKNLPQVIFAKNFVDIRSSGMACVPVVVTDSIRASLQSRLGLDLSVGSSFPMSWIKGDTAPHIDTGESPFQHTYLIYLNDSPGQFSVDSQSYPIQENTGFKFNEGLSHQTQGTNSIPRLLVGPMNELGEPVGFLSLGYYPTLAL